MPMGIFLRTACSAASARNAHGIVPIAARKDRRETLEVFIQAMPEDVSHSINSQGGSLAPWLALHILLKKMRVSAQI
jgi:hypothetical protein